MSVELPVTPPPSTHPADAADAAGPAGHTPIPYDEGAAVALEDQDYGAFRAILNDYTLRYAGSNKENDPDGDDDWSADLQATVETGIEQRLYEVSDRTPEALLASMIQNAALHPLDPDAAMKQRIVYICSALVRQPTFTGTPAVDRNIQYGLSRLLITTIAEYLREFEDQPLMEAYRIAHIRAEEGRTSASRQLSEKKAQREHARAVKAAARRQARKRRRSAVGPTPEEVRQETNVRNRLAADVLLAEPADAWEIWTPGESVPNPVVKKRRKRLRRPHGARHERVTQPLQF